MFTQFEEGGLLSETRNNSESGDESYDNSIMPPLPIKEEMDVMDSGNESDHDPTSTEKLEDNIDGSQSHTNVNMRGASYKIRNRIKQGKPE